MGWELVKIFMYFFSFFFFQNKPIILSLMLRLKTSDEWCNMC